MQTIEKEVAATAGSLPAPAITAPTPQLTAASMFRPPILQRLLVGCWVLITINTLIFGFVIFLPQFFLRQGLTITNSLRYTVVLAARRWWGVHVAPSCPIRSGGAGALFSESVLTIVFGWTYAHFNAGSDPIIVLSVGAVLIVAIYIQTAILFGVYTPELFPTEIRLRANGICNTLGRGATVVSPFVVGYLMVNYQLPGVVWLMIGLVIVQILAVFFWGVEPAKRSLEGLDPKLA